MLLGIKDNTGLGNNADEIKTASLLMDNTVIRPFQELLIDCFDQILAYNDIALNLYFITLQPLEFTDVDRSVQTDEEIEEETGVKMSLKKIDGRNVYETIEEAEAMAEQMGCSGHHEHKDGDKVWYMPCENHSEMSIELGEQILDNLQGEVVGDEWELVDELSEGQDISDEDWANICIKQKKTLFQQLKDEIIAKPSGFSYLDSKNYKIRYKYAVGSKKKSSSTRDFCENMMRLSKSGIVYRLEDIDKSIKRWC